MHDAQRFSELIKAAPVRTVISQFQGLFGVELIVTPRSELEQALEDCTTEVFDSEAGKLVKRHDGKKFTAWVAGRVAGLHGLSIRKGLTLCGRALPESLKARADEPLACETETVVALCDHVVGFQNWVLAELSTIAVAAARRDEDSQEN